MNDDRWVITVMDRGDKINTCIIHSDLESNAREQAVEWINENYGNYSDWTLHKIYTDKK